MLGQMASLTQTAYKVAPCSSSYSSPFRFVNLLPVISHSIYTGFPSRPTCSKLFIFSFDLLMFSRVCFV